MYWVTFALGVFSTVVLVYMLLISIYIVLTWFSLDRALPAMRFLRAVVEPYLGWFRGLKFLRWGGIDVSPAAALVVLYFVSTLTRAIAVEGRFSVGIVLAILFKIVFGAVASLFLILGVLSLIRFLAIRFRWGGAELWAFFDSVLQPPAYALGRVLRPRSFVPYPTTLLVLTVSSLAVWGIGLVLADLSRRLLPTLPI